VYDTLFEATWETLQQFQKEVQMGNSRFAHLGQQLSLHPHLHCIVPAEEWTKRSNGKIVEVMVNFIQ
jgi:hypothetical protein